MHITDCFLFIKICWNSFCFFIELFYNFITNYNRWIINNTCQIIVISTITCSRIPNIIFFTYMMLFTITLTFMVSLPLTWITFFPSNLHLHLHDICFVDVFDSFIPVIMLNILRFKYSVLFATHILLQKSLRDYNFQHIYLI